MFSQNAYKATRRHNPEYHSVQGSAAQTQIHVTIYEKATVFWHTMSCNLVQDLLLPVSKSRIIGTETRSWLLHRHSDTILALYCFKIHIANSMQARTVHSQYYPGTQHTVYTHSIRTLNTIHSQYYPNREHSLHSQYDSATPTGNTLFTHSTLKRYSVHSRQTLRNTVSDDSSFLSSILYTLLTLTCTPLLNLAVQ